jgi:hypothetical protein
MRMKILGVGVYGACMEERGMLKNFRRKFLREGPLGRAKPLRAPVIEILDG